MPTTMQVMGDNHELETILTDVASLATDCLHQENAPRSIQELGQLYDALVSQSPEQEGNIPLFHKATAVQADFYRGILGVSSLLLDRLLPNTPSTQTIQATQHQSALLLGLQVAVHALGSSLTGELMSSSSSILPTNHPILQEWVEPLLYSALPESQRSTNLLTSFDPQSLEQEQDSLLQMAMTPIPAESRKHQPLVATLISNPEEKEEGTGSTANAPTSVAFYPMGRLQTMQKEPQQQWHLSAESTVDYKDPYMTITHLLPLDSNGCSLCPSPRLPSSETDNAIAEVTIVDTKDIATTTSSFHTLTLDVGKNGYPWWERTSRVVQQLSEVVELQEELASLFPADTSTSCNQ